MGYHSPYQPRWAGDAHVRRNAGSGVDRHEQGLATLRGRSGDGAFHLCLSICFWADGVESLLRSLGSQAHLDNWRLLVHSLEHHLRNSEQPRLDDNGETYGWTWSERRIRSKDTDSFVYTG